MRAKKRRSAASAATWSGSSASLSSCTTQNEQSEATMVVLTTRIIPTCGKVKLCQASDRLPSLCLPAALSCLRGRTCASSTSLFLSSSGSLNSRAVYEPGGADCLRLCRRPRETHTGGLDGGRTHQDRLPLGSHSHGRLVLSTQRTLSARPALIG